VRYTAREVNVSLLLTESMGSMQPDATTSAPGTPPSSGGGGAPPTSGFASQPLIMLALMFVVFYFFLLRPQQKKQREVDDMLKSLQKGDKVRTSGGIRGEITDLTDTEVTLLIADKVKVNVLRSHIATRIPPVSSEAKEKA
jgi:preprotein translocase subunit YajC